MSKKEVAVVIPMYKAVLSNGERRSLERCVSVLKNHPMIIAKPEHLDLSALLVQYDNLSIENFPSMYFTDIQAYNRLMMSAEFYQRFVDFEYILIYQLDAYIFSDQLTEWCQKGYDYIGAPWLRDWEFTSPLDEIRFNIKKKIATVLGLTKEDGITPKEIILQNSVGNGGFSLRKVSAFLKVINQFRVKIDYYLAQNGHQFNEDVFFGIEVNRFVKHIKTPDYREALAFSVEFFPKRSIQKLGKLPFGCHAWDVHEPAFWEEKFNEAEKKSPSCL